MKNFSFSDFKKSLSKEQTFEEYCNIKRNFKDIFYMNLIKVRYTYLFKCKALIVRYAYNLKLGITASISICFSCIHCLSTYKEDPYSGVHSDSPVGVEKRGR